MRDEGLLRTEAQFAAQDEQIVQLARIARDEFARELAQLQEMATAFLGDRLTRLTEAANKEGLQKYEDFVSSGRSPPPVRANAR